MESHRLITSGRVWVSTDTGVENTPGREWGREEKEGSEEKATLVPGCKGLHRKGRGQLGTLRRPVWVKVRFLGSLPQEEESG